MKDERYLDTLEVKMHLLEERLTIAQMLVKCLENEGVEYICGLYRRSKAWIS